MTIDEIYRTVRVIANKEQRGFLKPSEFNLLADKAQMELFTQRYNNVKEYQTVRAKTGSYTVAPGVSYATSQKVIDDLRPFVTYAESLTFSGGWWQYPTNYLHALSLSFGGYPIEFVGEDRLFNRLNSSIVAPSIEHPIAVQAANGFIIYTTTSAVGSGLAFLTYLRRPHRPYWAFTEVDGNPIYNPTNSVNFEFEDQVHNELITKILTYLGIHIRDKDIYTYSTAQEQTGV